MLHVGLVPLQHPFRLLCWDVRACGPDVQCWGVRRYMDKGRDHVEQNKPYARLLGLLARTGLCV
jgi:hypothetical protein